MNALVQPSATMLAARLLERHSAEQITLAVKYMLAVLDYLDGDPDSEPDDHHEDDDPQGQCDEDGVNTHLGVLFDPRGPGCEISDPDVQHNGCEPEGFAA